MKEAIYSWIKCLAIFYILLTMLIHLVPTGKYQRYVRFFMGLLLMVMLITPMLSILEKAKTLPESFSSLYQQEEKKRLTLDMENLQKSLLEKGVEEQLEKNIPEFLKKKGIEVTACKVHIEGELLKACLWTKEVPDGELERGIKDELAANWGTREETVKSLLGKMGSRQWVILLLLGLLLTVIALPVSDKKDSSPEVKSSSFFSASSEENTDAERTVLEKKLEDLLSQTEGVGKVQVLLMTGEEKDSSSFYDSGNQAVTGVLIVAEGADNSVVSRNIVEGVMALFQLDAHKIKVMKMK